PTPPLEERVRSASEPTLLSEKELPNGIVQAVISLPALQDTYVASNPRSLNFGGSDTLLLGYNAEGSNLGALRPLLWFDFPGPIPSGSIINSARVRLYLYGVTGGGMNVQIRHLVSGWNEFAVTWDSHEPDWGGADTSTGIGTATGWIEVDITDLARHWQNGSEANDGIILLGDENPSEHQRAFYSRNAGNGQHPQLIVDYSQAAPDREPPRTQFVHPGNRYQHNESFRVEWKADDPGNSGVDYFDVQYREPGQNWRDWVSHTTHTSETFVGQDGKTYEFRARAVDKAHNVEAFPNNAQAATTVDTLPPTVTIQQLPTFTGSDAVQLNWSGTDTASGIRAYDLQFRIANQGWNDLLVNSPQTAYTFNGANGQQLEFRVSAIDNANHASAWDAPGTLTRTTIDSVTPLACIVLIQADGANSYLVEWASDDGNGSGVRAYDVRYRFNNGDWQTWQQQVGFTSARFTPTQGNGTYHFTVRAIDNANNQGNYQDKFGSILRVGPSTTITDTNVLYLPIMRHQHICQL
ncbi:MAG: fibronectin type III domain-containing protein, partial [Caldilineaceae bacterium]|nr:fibronectin type III domain-containing protein [Caldilineaceae bacterium]